MNPFTAAAASVLDADALERLRALDPTGSNHLMERVLKAFQASVGRLLPMLQEAQQDNDLAGIGHVAHTLKSSSASIGAIKLSQLCAEIEQMIRRGEGHALGTRVDDLTREIGAVIQSLRSLLEHD
ncbi:MAG: Hpt domain-containing protein [Aquabacterium sp.]|nr:Hpt domain-containing protein [Aquabacterium sp.]